MNSVFLVEAKANSVLKRYPRANGLLEELKKGNIERECYEERCDKEEAREAFENDEKTAEFWKDYTNGLYGGSNTGQNWYPFYLTFPLVIGLLVVVLIIFVTWRCLFQKTAHRQSMYMQSRSREDTDDRAIPDGRNPILPSFSILHSPQEEMFEGSGRSPVYLSYTERPMGFLPIEMSHCEPPPSYEEVAGESSTPRNESACHLDPPPQYEDIVNSISVPRVNIK
ncbi:transmembrane gamma-carboxyglutamic acid protein 1-like [Thamnophis elegans]|uniref:transmembrane gamma-carboxyglutamic acid protein 1-like n=1 Tax=Thamnophis elegans TaxID=35005 RepID=UPI001378B4C1|nr:transmembrane gamma-carboxyglutamic acid protein 1-like [Thamnophis elegans]XP_032084337.1 transmembrane gamma-carboxyglutamic acid protein 1-like [Thamnophis elegans]